MFRSTYPLFVTDQALLIGDKAGDGFNKHESLLIILRFRRHLHLVSHRYSAYTVLDLSYTSEKLTVLPLLCCLTLSTKDCQLQKLIIQCFLNFAIHFVFLAHKNSPCHVSFLLETTPSRSSHSHVCPPNSSPAQLFPFRSLNTQLMYSTALTSQCLALNPYTQTSQ